MEYSTDLKAFNQLFADYQGRFIRFANIYVRDIAVAEDFTIEALMQYWENLRKAFSTGKPWRLNSS